MTTFFTYPFLVGTRFGHYFYDPVTHQLIPTDQALFEAVARVLSSADPAGAWKNVHFERGLQTKLDALRSNGDLLSRSIELIPAPTEVMFQTSDSRQWQAPKHFTIELTNSCNLACSYCCFSGKVSYRRGPGNDVISRDKLRAAIGWYLENSDPDEDRTITFYGGEPLLHFELLTYAADYALSKCSDPTKLKFSLTTNGTLLSLEVAQSLIDRKFSFGVSLDGNKATHDWARRDKQGAGSFNVIIENLQRLWLHYGEAVAKHLFLFPVIDTESEGHDYLGWLSLLQEFPFLSIIPKRFNNISLVGNSPNFYESQKYDDDELNAQLEFFRHYKDYVLGDIHEDIGLFRWTLDPDMKKIHQSMSRLPDRMILGGMCVPGQMRLMLGLDGRLYPCERVDDRFQIGSIECGVDRQRVRSIATQWTNMVNRLCKGCWAVRFCGRCFSQFAGCENIEAYFATNCSGIQYRWGRNLAIYSGILELKANCWDYLQKR